MGENNWIKKRAKLSNLKDWSENECHKFVWVPVCTIVQLALKANDQMVQDYEFVRLKLWREEWLHTSRRVVKMLSGSLSSIGQEIKLKGHVCWEQKEESRNHKS